MTQDLKHLKVRATDVADVWDVSLPRIMHRQAAKSERDSIVRTVLDKLPFLALYSSVDCPADRELWWSEKPYSLETNPDIISRVVVGSRGTMPSDAGMKPPKRKELNSPEIETDLSRIQSLSREYDEENWEFRSWLKQNAPDDIDGIVQALSQKYFALIDCTQCANCCRSLQMEFKKSELHTIAETLGQSIKEFEKQFMSEGMVNPPCPMLDGKLCSIYDNRPEVCRSFPHLEKPLFTTRLMGVIDNVAICPIAFNAYEELKTKLAWPKGHRDLRR